MSIFRNTVWFIKGLREYTKGGYQSAAKSFNCGDLEGIDAAGRSYLITGANSGIGKVIALEIAKRGGAVHLVCRNEERGKAAVDDIRTATNNESIYLHIVDLGKPVDVLNFAKKFRDEQQKLDVLVNNAGCMVHERKLNSLGFESNFCTNSLAVYILTETLIPALKKSTDPRIVNVSSGGMLLQKLDLADMQSAKVQPFDATLVYAQHKRQQIVMTEEFSKIHPQIKFVSMHPGWADTPAVQTSMPSFHAKMKDRLRSPEEGADTAVWLALSPSVKDVDTGKFFQDRKAVATHLPLAWTRSSDSDRQKLMSVYSSMYQQVQQAALEEEAAGNS